MPIRVWHAVNPTFMTSEITTVARGDFISAAVVNTEDKNVAYQLTNTIDKYWPENDGVSAYPRPERLRGWRSTSIGDLMETKNGFYMVAFVGFRKVEMMDESPYESDLMEEPKTILPPE